MDVILRQYQVNQQTRNPNTERHYDQVSKIERKSNPEVHHEVLAAYVQILFLVMISTPYNLITAHTFQSTNHSQKVLLQPISAVTSPSEPIHLIKMVGLSGFVLI